MKAWVERLALRTYPVSARPGRSPASYSAGGHCREHDTQNASTLAPILAPYTGALQAAGALRQRDAGADSDTQTARTITEMTSLAMGPSGAGSPTVRQALASIRASLLPDATAPEMARAIFWYVKKTIHFRDDPEHDELLIAPAVLLAMPVPEGDCDDFSMLTAALLQADGIPWEFVTVAADRESPGRFSHVYVRALIEDNR